MRGFAKVVMRLPLQRGLLHAMGGTGLTACLVSVLRWFLVGMWWWLVERANPDPMGGRCLRDRPLQCPSTALILEDPGVPTCRRPAF